MTNEAKSISLTSCKVIALRDVNEAIAAGATRLIVPENCVITPSASDLMEQRHLTLERCGSCAASTTALAPAAASPTTASSTTALAPAAGVGGLPAPNARLYSTPEAEAIKREICTVGKKLWMRAFVDGNGGNISYRIGPNEVLCTPTLLSKFDLTPEDICLVDLNGNQIAGNRPRTSEILMHLEVYKHVPEAKSVVHCHPPHATAYAITGKVPPNMIIPEFEVFVGKVALSPYKTPGTPEFAQTVIPYVRQHNTVLLANHGILCWADTVMHAEWYAEVLDTYCWTLMNATQLGVPISYISEQQGADLLALKKKLGLPDARFDPERMKECQLSDLQMPGAIAVTPAPCDGVNVTPRSGSAAEIEGIVQSVTAAVMAALGAK